MSIITSSNEGTIGAALFRRVRVVMSGFGTLFIPVSCLRVVFMFVSTLRVLFMALFIGLEACDSKEKQSKKGAKPKVKDA